MELPHAGPVDAAAPEVALERVHRIRTQPVVARQAQLDAALVDLKPIPRVIELDRKQPESTLTYTQYMQRVLSDKRKRQGLESLRKHQPLLDKIGTAYGVSPAVIVALWGLETYYGRITGGFPVIAALATLALGAGIYFLGRRLGWFDSRPDGT